MPILETIALCLAVVLSLLASVQRAQRMRAVITASALATRERREREVLELERAWLEQRLSGTQEWIGCLTEQQARALVNNMLAELRDLSLRTRVRLAP